MAFGSGDAKCIPDISNQLNNNFETINATMNPNYSSYNCRTIHQIDENHDVNSYNNKNINQSSTRSNENNRTIKKIDVATMTDPLSIDFRRTSEYLARCSNSLGLSRSFDSNLTNSIDGTLIYHCPECPNKFEDRDLFNEHLENHKQRPHICDICGASLKRKEHLDRHKQGHNKDRPYKCTLCCKAFKRNEHLARHTIIHSGSKNQICTKCGKAFFRKDHLKKHIQSHNSSNKIVVESQTTNLQERSSPHETLDNIAMMVRQLRAPPFSILRT
ncbi:zinc finger protein 616 [Microplitis demolitor]|uniref:zinc finger protein 616 n=1 Tax=Microplitis demolitor TaxID=69319 RepID=UPI0004CD9E0E|nr:zinc finger protein 616 [Microplitis demolitor]